MLLKTRTMNPMTTDTLQQALSDLFAPWVQALNLKVERFDADSVTLRLPQSDQLSRVGGMLCGQAMMAAADTAMVLALSSALGAFRPMTTVQLQTSFLRPVPADAGELRVVCTVLRRGRSLAFGEIEIATADGRLAAHATTTYALL